MAPPARIASSASSRSRSTRSSNSDIRARDAHSGGREAFRIEDCRVVDGLACARSAERVRGIGGGQYTKEDGRVADRSRHRSSAVLAMGDRNDPRAADQTDGWLDPDKAVSGRGTDDRAVRLSTDGSRGEACCARCARSGAGPAW